MACSMVVETFGLKIKTLSLRDCNFILTRLYRGANSAEAAPLGFSRFRPGMEERRSFIFRIRGKKLHLSTPNTGFSG